MPGLVKPCATEICSFAFSLIVNDWHSIRTKVIGKQEMSRYLESSLSERYWILQLYLRFEEHGRWNRCTWVQSIVCEGTRSAIVLQKYLERKSYRASPSFERIYIICVWANSAAPDGLQGQNLPRKSPWDAKHSLYLSDWVYEVGGWGKSAFLAES